MKRMKKIAGIVLSIMMILGMSSMAAADTGTAGTADTGKITIKNTENGQTYKLYRIFKLESFSGDNYAYTVEADWEAFVNQVGVKDVYLTLDSGYVSWKTEKNTAADAAEFAKLAKKYATTNNLIAIDTKQSEGTDITFDSLPLGYYLVDSSKGTLCALDTVDQDLEIQEKNGTPTVEKKVQEDSKVGTDQEYGDSNTADIGQEVKFRTTIIVQNGDKNYVLHDKMSEGLTFKAIDSVKLVNSAGAQDVGPENYTMSSDPKSEGATCGCTFHIKFTSDFCDKLQEGQKIEVSYSATLNEKAVIGADGNSNETWLEYGDNHRTTSDETVTRTYKIPVFKYEKTNSGETGLLGAKFVLSKDSEGNVPIELVKISTDGSATDLYRIANKNETGKMTEITTPVSGKFEIQGLDADIYYLKETKAPDGYNKLAKVVKVVIDEDGTIKMGEPSETVELVKIENKTGFRLPSTGDIGTKIFYLLGGVLVLGSGIVLITKRRMK